MWGKLKPVEDGCKLYRFLFVPMVCHHRQGGGGDTHAHNIFRILSTSPASGQLGTDTLTTLGNEKGDTLSA